ncbi:MAG: zinc-binding dehydrogenase [Acidobacteria bacterium]|nr:zinc-binding dehydrogenase [Acidobacteriota bacterium]
MSAGPRRVVIPRYGGPGVLRIEPFVAADPGPQEVAIDVRAAGVNFADLYCRVGLYDAAPPVPFTPGFEVAGTVAAAGGRTRGFAPGQRVVGVTRFGGCATRINLDAAWVRPLADAWSFAAGAGFPVVFLTAWYGLFEAGRLATGETVVVQSAAGGVGMAACQLARAAGARVIGTVGSEAKRAAALAAGAQEVVVAPRYDGWARIRELAGGDGVDVVLDAIGGRQLREAYRALRPCGRLVTFGFAQMMPRRGPRNWPLLAWRYLRTPRFSPFGLVGRNRTVAGFNLVHLWRRPQLFDEALRQMLALADEGRIRPLPTTEIPFEDVARAHELLQSRRTTGKIVLAVTADPS